MNKKFTQKQIDKIDETFTDIIRERLSEKEFWKWVSGWLDSDMICEQAEEWDAEDKLETIKEFDKNFKL